MGHSTGITKFFADLIETKLGIIYKPENYYQLKSRLDKVVTAGNYASVLELYQRAKTNQLGPMENLLLDLATNNETSFFRDPNVWQAIKEHLFDNDEFLNSVRHHLRIWCCACSFGQEPYTIAMILRDIQRQRSNLTFNILASDVSDRALAVATKGIYTSLHVQRGLPEQFRDLYFEKVEQPDQQLTGWQVKDEIKNQIRFQRQNLLESWEGMGNFDLIFCRNVLIYQNKANKLAILDKIYNSLNPDGYLLLGGSESLIALGTPFAVEKVGRLVLNQKSSSKPQFKAS